MSRSQTYLWRLPKLLTKLELQIMETFWIRGACSVREIQEAFPAMPAEPRAYTTVQSDGLPPGTGKGPSLRPSGSATRIFSRPLHLPHNDAQRRLIDELLSLFGGHAKPVMAHLVESGKLTLEDVKEAEKDLRKLARKDVAK